LAQIFSLIYSFIVIFTLQKSGENFVKAYGRPQFYVNDTVMRAVILSRWSTW